MSIKLAIVGRPNVGKSALFNRIIGKRLAIVDEAEGVTRDRLYSQSDLFGKAFELIDTGGINARSNADFNDEIRQQAEIAIEEADSLILVVDALCGPTDLDVELARRLQKGGKRLTLAINKIDGKAQETLLHNFHLMSIEQMIPVSAVQGHGISELLEAALDGLEAEEMDESAGLRIAIIGRPNVGKSTFINTLLNEARCIVSPIAGTTRDSVDIAFTFEDQDYTLIDTAGIRKKKSEHEAVEKFSAIRTKRAIERADLCLFLFDAQKGLTAFDKRIATQIDKAGKPCILFANKWDLIHGHRMEHAEQALRHSLAFLQHCPIIFGSASMGRNLPKALHTLQMVHAESQKRIATPDLNRFVEKTLQTQHPPTIRAKRLRIYYMTQVSTSPPRFLLFVNHPSLLAPSYERYLYNQFRKTFQFTGTPLQFLYRGKPSPTRQAAQPALRG